MALTQISTQGIKDGTITGSDLATNVDLVDNQKIRFGTGNDLEIYHSSSNSFIRDVGTGVLSLDTNGSAIRFRKGTTETLAIFNTDGAVELYYDNSKKLETVTGGVYVYGDLLFGVGTTGHLYGGDNDKVILGSGSDFQLFHDGINSFITNTTGDFLLRNSAGNEIKIQAVSGEQSIIANANGSVDLYYDGTKKFETVTNGVTVTGRILPTGSSNVGVVHNDNIKSVFGNSDDLQIYHDGSNSYVSDSGTGDLRLSGNVVKLNNSGNTETMLKATENGAVELYYDNALKFETTSSGVQIAGKINFTGTGQAIDLIDNQQIRLGTGDDLQIYHDGSNSYLEDAGTGKLILLSSQVQINNPASNETMANFIQNGAVELYHDDSKKFETSSTGVTVLGTALVGTNVELNSDAYIKVGASYDLQIYHVSNHSSIENSTGELRIKNTSGSDMVLNSTGRVQLQVANGEKAVYCDNNGAVELYYNNSKVLQTHDASGYSGIDVLGDEGGHAVINLKADEGDDGADCWQWTAQTNGASYIKNLSNGSTYEYNVKMIGGGAVELYYDAVKKFETTSAGVSVTGSISSSGNISLVDTGALQLGTSNDFTLTHNGTNSVIDNNTGDLIIRGDADDVKILAEDDIVLRDNDDSTNFIHCINGGSVILYDDGTEMFRTDNHGVTVQKELRIQGSASSGTTHFNYLDSGSNYITQNDSSTTYFRNASGTNRTKILGNGNWIWEDNYKIMLGSSQDLQIYHNGSNSYIDNEVGSFYIRDTGGAEKVRINGYGTAITGGLLFGTDTAAANALDDYEEGSLNWELAKSSTPSLGTDNGSNVKYVKVGRLVHISGRIRTDSCGSAGGDNFVFQSGSTLPFTPENAGTCVVGHWRSQDQTDKSLTASIAWLGGSTTMYLYTIDSKADYQATQNNVPADSQTNLVITFSLTYRANS